MKKLLSLFKRTIVLTIILACIYVFLSPYIFKNYIYIKPYNDYVSEASLTYDVEENLIYAVMQTESKFKTTVTSSQNAIGLMQIVKPTAEELVEEMQNDNVTSDLENPRNNIYIGTKYIKKLLKRYDNNMYIAIAAYNAGIGNVDNWLKEGIIEEDSSSIDNIPFKETRAYVKKVLKAYKMYNILY